MHRVGERAGDLDDVHQVALVADRHAVGDVQNPVAAVEQLRDDVVDLQRPGPQQGVGQLV